MKISQILENTKVCPHCGGPITEVSELDEGKKDACYYKIKASAKVWPSAYASGRLVQCRKKGAANYGSKSEGVAEGSGGDQYKIKSIGHDSKGDYYVSPSTGEKVYKSGVKRGDHENPKTGEHKGVAEGIDQEFDMRLAKILKQRGYKGPVKLEQLGMKWVEAIGDIVDIDDYTMVQGNDPEYDGWVSYVYGLGRYAYGAEQGYTTGTAKRVEIDTKDKQGVAEGIDELTRVLELSGLNLTLDEQFDMIELMVENLAMEHGVDAETIWEDFESVDDEELFEAAAWQKKSGKSKTGGLNAKGVASYRRENPGSKLQTAVTTKPSKLKPGSKAAKRRKSFCARMGGVKGPMKKPNGKPTRKALALRKWNC